MVGDYIYFFIRNLLNMWVTIYLYCPNCMYSFNLSTIDKSFTIHNKLQLNNDVPVTQFRIRDDFVM